MDHVPVDVLRKRKHGVPEPNDGGTTFKKAKHWWQVKGRSQNDGSRIACTSSTEENFQTSLNADEIDERIETTVHSRDIDIDSGARCKTRQTGADDGNKSTTTGIVESEQMVASEGFAPATDADPENVLIANETNSGRRQQSNGVPVVNTTTWMKRNTAHAIVDNVFNQTLEEMGLSPNDGINVADRLAVESQSIATIINRHGLSPVKKNNNSNDIHVQDGVLSKNLQIIEASKGAGINSFVNQVDIGTHTVSETIPSCSSLNPNVSSSLDLPSCVSSVCEADSTVNTSFDNREHQRSETDICSEISTTFTQRSGAIETHNSISCPGNSSSIRQVPDTHVTGNACSSFSNPHVNQNGAPSDVYVQNDPCNSTAPSLSASSAGTSRQVPNFHSPHQVNHLYSDGINQRDHVADSTTASTNFLEIAVSAAISSQGLTLRDGSQ